MHGPESAGAPAASESGSAALYVRLAACGALLLCEYLAISVRFDARDLLLRPGISSVLGYVGDAATIALVVAAATLTLLGPELREAVASLPPVTTDRRTLALQLGVHLVAYAAFFAATGQVFEAPDGAGPATAWIAAWMLAGAAVALTWVPLALPWGTLRVLLPKITPPLLLGAAAGALAWLAGGASASAWDALGPLTLSTVAWLLYLVVDEVWMDATTRLIGTPYFDVHVAPVCSGFEGIGLIVIFLGGYMVLERRTLRFPRVLSLLPIAVVAVWCANALRITLLVLVGSYVSPALAVSGFHSKAGWLFFCVVALGFVALARRSQRFSTAPAAAASAERAGTNVAAPYLMPLLVLLAAALVTGLLTVDFDYLYPLRMACVLFALWVYRGHYRPFAFRPHWDSVALGAAVFAIWRVLAQGGAPEAVAQMQAGLAELPPWAAAGWLVARVAGMSLIIPVVEELAFRGYLLRRVLSADFDLVDARKVAPWAWAVSSVAFGAVHGADWLPGILAGLAFALAFQRRGRIGDAVVAHAVANVLLCADAALFGSLRWWA